MSKIVDNNGKLFGKINLLDLFIFVVIGVLLISGIYKVVFVDESIYTPEYKSGQITLRIASVNARQSETFEDGDIIRVQNVQDLGTIADLSIVNKMDNVSSQDGDVYIVANPLYYEVTMVLETDELFVGSDGFTYVGQNYKVNAGMTLSITNGLYSASATVVSVNIDK